MSKYTVTYCGNHIDSKWYDFETDNYHEFIAFLEKCGERHVCLLDSTENGEHTCIEQSYDTSEYPIPGAVGCRFCATI